MTQLNDPITASELLQRAQSLRSEMAPWEPETPAQQALERAQALRQKAAEQQFSVMSEEMGEIPPTGLDLAPTPLRAAIEQPEAWASRFVRQPGKKESLLALGRIGDGAPEKEAFERITGIEDTNPEFRREVWRELEKMESSYADRFLNTLRSFNRSIVGGLTAVPKEIGIIMTELDRAIGEDAVTPAEERFAFRLGKQTDKLAEKYFPPDERFQDSFWFEKVPAGFGSVAAFLLGGSTAKGIKGGRVAVSTVLGMAMEGVGQYEAAKQYGATEEEALLAARWGNAIGVTEVGGAPWRVFRWMQRADKAAGGALHKGLSRTLLSETFKGSRREAIQEFIQSASGNLVAQQIYDKDRELLEGTLEATAIGAITGGPTTFAAVALHNRATGKELPAPDATPEHLQHMAKEAIEAPRAEPPPVEPPPTGQVTREQLEAATPKLEPSEPAAPPAKPAAPRTGQVTREQLEAATPKLEPSEPAAPPAKPAAPRTAYLERIADTVQEKASPELLSEIAQQEEGVTPAQIKQLGIKKIPSKPRRIEIANIIRERTQQEVPRAAEPAEAPAPAETQAAPVQEEVGAIQDEAEGQTPGIRGEPEGVAPRTPDKPADVPGITPTPVDFPLSWIQKFAGAIKVGLRPRGRLPEAAHKRMVANWGEVRGELKQAAFNEKRLRDAMPEALGRKPNESDWVQANEVLLGQRDVNTMPEAMREPIMRLRNHLDQLSRKLIDIGAAEGPLAKRIEENIGAYLHRSYRVFDDPDWAKKVDPKIRENAKSALRSEFADYNEGQIENTINRLLFRGAADRPTSVIAAASKLGSKDLGILKARKDIPKWLRELWGEHKDPRLNYLKSINRMGHLIGNHQFLAEVREDGLGEFLWEEGDKNIPPDAVAKIAADSSSVMAPLNGLYTTPEVRSAFEKQLSPQNYPWYMRWYFAANATVKYGKTILSPQTHARNFFSNPAIAVAQGHWRVWKLKDAFRKMGTSLTNKGPDEFQAYIKQAIQLGVLHDTVRAGEIQDTIREASKMDVDEFTDRWSRNPGKLVGQVAEGLYRIEDEVWKLYAWENEKARYRKAHPDWSEDKLDRHAADIVRNTFPTYSLTGPLVQFVRRFPLFGTFPSFPAEIMRTSYNTLALIKKEMNTPEERAIGLQRLTGSIVASTGAAAIGAASRALFGLSKDDEEDFRTFLPPWSENSDILWLSNPKNGEILYVDLSYTDPYAYWKNPIRALLRGEDLEEAVIKAGMEFFVPFLGVEILAGKLIEVTANKDLVTGREIYNPQDAFEKKSMAIVGNIWEAFEPGAISWARRTSRAAVDVTEQYGKDRSLGVEIGALTGFRVSKVDVRQATWWKGQEYSKNAGGATRVFNSVYRRRGSVSERELREAYESMVLAKKHLFHDLHNATQAAIRAGVSEQTVMDQLVSSGVGKRNTEDVLIGLFRPILPSRQNPTGIPPEEWRRRIAIVESYPKEFYGEAGSQALLEANESYVNRLVSRLGELPDEQKSVEDLVQEGYTRIQAEKIAQLREGRTGEDAAEAIKSEALQSLVEMGYTKEQIRREILKRYKPGEPGGPRSRRLRYLYRNID